MSHSEVMKWFEYYFPDYAGERIDVFFPNGRNSIRIRQKNGQEFIFTYHSQKEWKLETITSFLNGIEGRKKSKMCEIMNYIFRSLHNSDRRLDVISRAIRKQQKFNNCVAVFSVLVTMNFFIGEIERQEQAAKIKKLESEIEELKRDKGE